MIGEQTETGKVTFRKLSDEEALTELGSSMITVRPTLEPSKKVSKTTPQDYSIPPRRRAE